MTNDTNAILIENLIYKWPKQKNNLLEIAKLEIKKGEQIFLVGPSGSGKTTLLNLISGILIPNKGNISIDGILINKLSSYKRDLYRVNHIGFIFQQFNLIPYLSIEENVLLPCLLSNERNSHESNAKEQTKRLLLELDLPQELWSKKVRQLSIGQQQRVAAARALLGKPSIIIADEPTSSLDYDRRISFLQLLLKQCQQQNTTLLFVSHDLTLSNQFTRTINIKDLNLASIENKNA